MINIIHGDVTTAKGFILHVVNCKGVMNAGVAKVIRNKWPKVYDEYMEFCQINRDELIGNYGMTRVSDAPSIIVVSIFAQEEYGRRPGKRYVSYDALDLALKRFSYMLEHGTYDDMSINFPAMGTGLGGGLWPVIEQLIDHRIPDKFSKNLWLK